MERKFPILGKVIHLCGCYVTDLIILTWEIKLSEPYEIIIPAVWKLNKPNIQYDTHILTKWYGKST